MHRRDLPLTLTPVVASALKAMVTSLAPALEALLGDDPELFELAAIAADDGAPPQPIHADLRPTGWLQSANASTDIDDAMAAAAVPSASVYVAVQDVLDPKMGPTLFLRRTHTAEAHTALYGEGGDADGSGAASGGAGGGARASLLRQSRRVLGLVPAGGGALFDQRLLHAGTANSAGRRSRLSCESATGGRLSCESATDGRLCSRRCGIASAWAVVHAAASEGQSREPTAATARSRVRAHSSAQGHGWARVRRHVICDMHTNMELEG